MKTWIVVLTWNGRDDTLALLSSLEKAIDCDTTVLVVDNGSSDATCADVADAFPWAKVLQNGANLGFAAGNNRGIDMALARGAEIVMVLNNDTLVDAGFLEPLKEAAQQPMTACSPDIRYAADRDVSWFYGGAVRNSLPQHLTPTEQPTRRHPVESEILTGCCLVASADTWRLVGGFDERYFLIFEDSDWSLRARSLGVRLVLEPRSTVLHKVSSTFQASPSAIGRYYYARNGVLFNTRWAGRFGATRFAWCYVLRPSLGAVRQHRSPSSGLRPELCGLAAGFAQSVGEMGRLAQRISMPNARSLPRDARSAGPHRHLPRRLRLPGVVLDWLRTTRDIADARRRRARFGRPAQDSLVSLVASEERVLSGPFEGLELTNESFWGGLAARMAGTYEAELHPALETLLERGPSRVIDIGAAEGYYATGIARRLPSTEVIAFELEGRARASCRRNAVRNGLTNVAVRGRVTPARLRRALTAGALVICDCEGYEDELLNLADIPELRSCSILVELHDFARPGVTARIAERFASSHTIEIIPAAPRRAVPAQLNHLPYDVARRAVDEGRPLDPPMSWAVMVPLT